MKGVFSIHAKLTFGCRSCGSSGIEDWSHCKQCTAPLVPDRQPLNLLDLIGVSIIPATLFAGTVYAIWVACMGW